MKGAVKMQNLIKVSALRVLPFLAIIFIFITLLPALSKAGAYTDSAHGGYNTAGKGVKRLAGYSAGNCAHCHEQHASINGTEPEPVNGPADHLQFADMANNTFCNYCHDISQLNGADNIASQISKTYAHDPNSTIAPVDCLDCHNPHLAQREPHNPAFDDNLVQADSPLLGVNGVSASWSTPTLPVNGTENLRQPSLTPVETITMEYQLCLKCHGGQIAGLTDIASQVNPNNYSHHPVTGTDQWRNDNIRSNYQFVLIAPWNSNLDARLYCSDCHGPDPVSNPVGPHGSNNQYLLKDWGSTTNPTAAECYDNLCLRCHAGSYGDDSTPTGSPWKHSGGGSGQGKHLYSGEAAGENRLGCQACHGGPAAFADFSGFSPSIANGGREGAIHGENFMWQNPDGSSNPADHFLMGGYLVGIRLADRQGNGNNTCWSAMTGTNGCHSGNGAHNW